MEEKTAGALQKRITLIPGIAIAITMVVGSGIFALPGLAVEVAGPTAAITGWLLVIALMPPFIQIFSYLGMRYPSAGGIAKFASMGIGPWSYPGFSLIASGALAVGMPAFFLVGGAYVAELLSLDPNSWRFVFAIIFAVLATLVNLRGVENMGLINKGAVVIIVALTLGLAISRLPGLQSHSADLAVSITTTFPPIAQLWIVATIVFWAFQGWENMSFGFEEIKNPTRTIPLVFWISFLIVSAMYLLFAWIVSASAISGTSVAGLSGVAALLGDGIIRNALLLLLIFVLFTNACAWVFGASRAFYSAARERLLPPMLAQLDHRGIPVNSLIASLVSYCMIIVVIDVGGIDVKYAFLLTTQGFILLYGAAIIAYMRDNASFAGYLIGGVAFISWTFLMSGFSWLMVYPAALFATGVMLSRRQFVR